jgi:DNA-binding NtrC family response regulator
VALFAAWPVGVDWIHDQLGGSFEFSVREPDHIRSQLEIIRPDAVIIAGLAQQTDNLCLAISQVSLFDPDLPVFVLSTQDAWSDVVSIMKAGARDFFHHPGTPGPLQEALDRGIKMYRLSRRVFLRDLAQDDSIRLDEMIGLSPVMRENFRMIRAVARSQATVLITGESGTGKELVAKAIHRLSLRSMNRFVDLNCGAIPRELLENELFGHEKGSFTGAHKRTTGNFEYANGGTLFLDEISEMDLSLQVKLLRVLQERSFHRIGGRERIDVDVRIVAATNRDLPESIRRGEFREDLYYRLNVVNIHLPPLRDRREDIPLLARHFLEYYSAKNGKIFVDFTSSALEALINYGWPGNIRELENTIERLVVLNSDTMVQLAHLPKHLQNVERNIPLSGFSAFNLEQSQVLKLEEVERQAIEFALLKYKGNMSVVAKKLGIAQATLYRKVRHFNLNS